MHTTALDEFLYGAGATKLLHFGIHLEILQMAYSIVTPVSWALGRYDSYTLYPDGTLVGTGQCG